MTKKEKAIQFLKLAGTGKVNEAFDTFIADDFIHHNQYFEGSRASLLKAMEDAHAEDPNESIETKNCYLENDTVITHTLVKKKEMDIAVVHIFKFNSNGKVTELWDLGQVVEKDSPNQYGLF